MGFLDDLKRQADAVKAEQQQRATVSERNLALTEAACKTVLQYWLQLAAQLNVLRPPTPARYVLDARLILSGLPTQNFRVDSRRRMLGGQEVCDHVVLRWSVRGGQRLTLNKDFVADIDRLEARLRQAGIQPLSTGVRDPQTGKLLSMQYELDDEIACWVRVVPEPETARLQCQLVNLESLETLQCELPAFELGVARLDELSKWIVGQPHRFLDGAQALRRSAPV